MDRLSYIVASPGSGKTTVASARFGVVRSLSPASRGVLGLSFTRSSAAELARRIRRRWGMSATNFPNITTTFDDLHVRIFHHLLSRQRVRWPGALTELEVVDDYSGFTGFRFLTTGNWRRMTRLSFATGAVYSGSIQVTSPESGIGAIADHQRVLASGFVSHSDIRSILRDAYQVIENRSEIEQWLAANFAHLIVDEVFDADDLDGFTMQLAVGAGLGVTAIGDPWQAVYGWRGARPDAIMQMLDSTGYVSYDMPQSFRFRTSETIELARQLRAGESVRLPYLASIDADVSIARNWATLWRSGENVLPLAFRHVGNATDAALNLLLDSVLRKRFGIRSFGVASAEIFLQVTEEYVLAHLDAAFEPVVESLLGGEPPTTSMDKLRAAARSFSGRTPRRLASSGEVLRVNNLQALGSRVRSTGLIPGLTVHQAKGREWNRVGLALTQAEIATLAAGLQPTSDDHCILYVAATRARDRCGLLSLDP